MSKEEATTYMFRIDSISRDFKPMTSQLMLRVRKRGTNVAICQTRDVQLYNHLAIAQLIDNAKEYITIPHKRN